MWSKAGFCALRSGIARMESWACGSGGYEMLGVGDYG